MATRSIGYIALLRQNVAFRRLWYGQVVSQLGDWFDSIALYTLLLELTGSGQAVGALLVAQFLPPALVGPFAGVLIDRLPRKLVMVLSDLARAGLVLALLLVQGPSDIWIIYVVTALKFSLTAFFEPSRSAIVPQLANRNELIAANGLSGATWSAMLAIGAALGGLVVGTLGMRVAFLLDALSFLLSAVLIYRIPVVETGRQRAPTQPHPTTSRSQSATIVPHTTQTIAPHQSPPAHVTRELAEGFGYIVQHADILCYTFTKALWSMGGGVLLLLTLYGREIFPLGRDGALSIGLFYAARGIGAGLGPLVAQRYGGETVRFLRRSIGPAFFLTALGYLWLSGIPALLLALLAVILAHMGGSIQWVFSTALLQIHVPDQLRGRIFAIEYAALTLMTALSSYLTGVANDAGWSPQALALILSLVFAGTGTLLTLTLIGTAAFRQTGDQLTR